MSAPTTTVIEPRNLLISGGVPAGPPQWQEDRTGQIVPPRTAVAPRPADESAACREDWHAEVLGATWMRTPAR